MSGAVTEYPTYTISSFHPGLVRNERIVIDAKALDDFMALTGDRHPLHADASYALARGFRDRVCHGLLASAYLSPFIARHFLGSTGLFVSFSARFQKPVYAADSLVLTGRVKTVSTSTGLMQVTWSLTTETGELVQSGTAGCLLEVRGR